MTVAKKSTKKTRKSTPPKLRSKNMVTWKLVLPFILMAVVVGGFVVYNSFAAITNDDMVFQYQSGHIYVNATDYKLGRVEVKDYESSRYLKTGPGRAAGNNFTAGTYPHPPDTNPPFLNYKLVKGPPTTLSKKLISSANMVCVHFYNFGAGGGRIGLSQWPTANDSSKWAVSAVANISQPVSQRQVSGHKCIRKPQLKEIDSYFTTTVTVDGPYSAIGIDAITGYK